MPLKQHPTDPDKVVYTRREYDLTTKRPGVGLTDEDWKQLWAEFDSSDIENDFQDHMVSKYGAGHYTDADMYWHFQQQVIKQMVNAMLKEKNHG
jgi:hypothetical protein